MDMVWEHVRAVAADEVEQTLASLPPPLRERALALPVTFQCEPNEGQLADGIEQDTLGLFVGPDYADQEVTSFPVPPQIILFLRNFWEMVDGDEEEFRLEVRTTLLHELGHYLGLDEDEIAHRGLE
jgi:predicted Zn-dependent protease with MMP-like domain